MTPLLQSYGASVARRKALHKASAALLQRRKASQQSRRWRQSASSRPSFAHGSNSQASTAFPLLSGAQPPPPPESRWSAWDSRNPFADMATQNDVPGRRAGAGAPAEPWRLEEDMAEEARVALDVRAAEEERKDVESRVGILARRFRAGDKTGGLGLEGARNAMRVRGGGKSSLSIREEVAHFSPNSAGARDDQEAALGFEG